MKHKKLTTLFLFLMASQLVYSQNAWKASFGYGIGIQPRYTAFNSEVILLQQKIVVGEDKYDHGPAMNNFSLGLIQKHSEKVNMRYGINYQKVFSWNGLSTNSTAARYENDSLISPGMEKNVDYGYHVLGLEIAIERNLLTKNKDYNLWVSGGVELAYAKRFDSYELYEVETMQIRESFKSTYEDVLLRGMLGISIEKILTKKLSLRLGFISNPLYYFTPYQLKITDYSEDYQELGDQEYNYSVNPRIGSGELEKERIRQLANRLNFSLVFNL